MTPGLCLDTGEFIPASELNQRIEMKKLSDRALQSLRNAGNEAEEAADEIEELRSRIAELEAQLASGQGPVAEIAHTDSTGGYVNWLLHQGAPIKMGDKLFTQPAQKPLNRDQILDLYEETDPLCSLFTFRDIVADVEAEHNIKDKP
jgi:hypothetical protein